MTDKEKIFVNCDDLDSIPETNKENYLFEHDSFVGSLPKNAKVLQVGSMDGMRAVRLLKARPDLEFTGIEIESSLVSKAMKNIKENNLKATFIVGDITSPPSDLGKFDYVLCFNNTLGFISEINAAIRSMKELGDKVVISVYGEKFDDKLADEYFKSIGLSIEKIEGNKILLKDFSTVKRFSKGEVRAWGGRIIDTPLGYYCELG